MSSDLSAPFSVMYAVPIHRPSPDGICGAKRLASASSPSTRQRERRPSVQPSFFLSAATSMSAGAAGGKAVGAWAEAGAEGFAEAADEALGASDEPDFPQPAMATPE